jgi:hypothetical protein
MDSASSACAMIIPPRGIGGGKAVAISRPHPPDYFHGIAALPLDESNRKALIKMAHDTTCDGADGENRANRRNGVSGYGGSRNRHIENKASFHMAIGQYHPRVRVFRYETTVGTLLADFGIIMLLQPLDFRGELAALVLLRVEAHDESALEHGRHQPVEFSQMVDVGDHPRVHFGGDRGRNDDFADRGVDGVTAKDATLAACVAHIGK